MKGVEDLLDLISRVFGRETPSKEVAKERLRLVLVHDRSSVSPQFLQSLREDLLLVISRYMDIDDRDMDVNLTTTENQVALVANIPVKRLKRFSNA